MFSTLQRPKRKHNYIRRQYKRTGGHALAKTENRRIKTNWICKPISIRYRKEVRNKRIGYASRSMGSRTDHQALEPLIKKTGQMKPIARDLQDG